MAAIQNRDFVFTGLQSWDIEIGSNCKNIAAEIARNNRVLYVNAPLDIITLLKGRKTAFVKERIQVLLGKKPAVRQVDQQLWVYYPATVLLSINWIKQAFLFDLLNRFNNYLLGRQIRKAVRKLEWQNVIHFNDSDIYRCFYLKKYLQPAVSVYYSRDNLIGVDYWKKHAPRLEPLLIAKADVAVANSTYLSEYLGHYNQQAYYVGQGCDLSQFDPASVKAIPEVLKGLSGSLIGYVGALNAARLDVSLLEQLANLRKEWTFVFVGPEDATFQQSALHRLPNVQFIGPRDPEELPAFVAAFDVCLNPQSINPITIGNYPRKIDEYLAMGKPVVATATKAMSIFEEQVYLAAQASDYSALIEQALKEDTAEKQEARIAFARSHTWENNVLEIYKAIERVCSH